ncbi:MAG: hypothetical protein ABIK62_04410, partial [candidate division WOR-3 bacterium]
RGNGTSAKPIGSLVGTLGEGDTWYVTGDRSKGAAPSYNIFMITASPDQYITTPGPSVKLRVRVVPNPYFITNDWETSTFDRRIAFSGLPGECDIRIYTMAGDLVRRIKHRDTRAAQAGQAPPQPEELGGTEYWDLLNTDKQLVSSGIYVFHIQSDVGEYVGKFAIVR